jgi:hypothetical protein
MALRVIRNAIDLVRAGGRVLQANNRIYDLRVVTNAFRD